MIKSAETCETRPQEIFSVTDIFNFLTDGQINVLRNIEKINKKVISLTYSIIYNETNIVQYIHLIFFNHHKLVHNLNNILKCAHNVNV